MRRIVLLAGMLVSTAASAQRPPLDTTSFTKWARAGDPAVSNDGAYFLYSVWDGDSGPATFIIQARTGGWRRELPGAVSAAFTDDSRRAVVMTSNNSLRLQVLGSDSAEDIPNVSSFQLTRGAGSEWLLYQSGTPARELVLRNLATAKQQRFPGVTQHLLSEKGGALVLVTESDARGHAPQSLSWVKLADGTRIMIWEGRNVDNLVLDADGHHLAFRVNDTTRGSAASFWYYEAGTARAVPLTGNKAVSRGRGLQPDRIGSFSSDGGRLFVTLKESVDARSKAGAVQVDVWSYTDPKLQSQQLTELRLDGPQRCTAVIAMDEPHDIVLLQQEGEGIVSRSGRTWGDFVVIDGTKGDQYERYWNTAARPLYWLVSTQTGERKPINFLAPGLSPSGKYVVGFDAGRGDLYSYGVSTGVVRNVTRSLPIPLASDEFDEPKDKRDRGLGVAAWLADDMAVLVHDQFDIWQIDPAGKKAPLNVTNGYGRRNNVRLRLTGMHSGKILSSNAKLIVGAFDRATKNAGFYRIALGQKGDPELLTMGPYRYESEFGRSYPLKARDANVYLVRRESVVHSPNYFWTTDFRSFSPVSAVAPEAPYNWLTSELITFKALDGRPTQGILYKPEDFDATKKYPLILHYYERMSQELNKYQNPRGDGNGGSLDIAWFVSNGYLVFTPDIHYTIGEPGQSAYNSVVAAAQYLRGFPWVDGARMGLQGHSFGAYETNYLVTHTNLFAAAASSSGPSDLISDYGALWGSGAGRGELVENRQGRIGAPLWRRPDLYIKNSPIFNVDKITTPLLMVANKRDGNVPFSQGVELFTALRRLGKRGWMLQYDEGGHGQSGKEYVDYVVRMTQFFDHYLKGAPPPRWMTRGIPAREKGIDDGLELDHRSETPGPGLLAEQNVTSRSSSAP